MNCLHRYLCRSGRWKETVQERVPWVLKGADLGDDVLEVGPGPGLTTDLLRSRVPKLTVIEVDHQLAESLSARLRSTNVEVFTGDATAMPFSDGQFTAGFSFTMLHHIPSPRLQDYLLREMHRVIKPGAFSWEATAWRACSCGSFILEIRLYP
jgi:ubiquinone/menaquinone biosynthesis C-methylase UbiE